MKTLGLAEISRLTQAFIRRNQLLDYQLELVKEDEAHVLMRATNSFSEIYCQVTTDVEIIGQWPQLQEQLFAQDGRRPNRYLIYVFPDALVRKRNLYEELSRAERNDQFFRKVFIGLPDTIEPGRIERALADRIPLWFEERQVVLRQYVPVISEFVRDAALLELFLGSAPGAVVKRIEKDARFAYLLTPPGPASPTPSGLTDAARQVPASRRGTRLTGLVLENFRRFGRRSFDLDGDVVLVCGRNGTGKTTLCDAIELSIFPDLRRLQGDPDLSQKSEPPFLPFIRAGAVAQTARITLTGQMGQRPFTLETTVSETGTTKVLDGTTIEPADVVRQLTQSDELLKKGLLDILLHTHFLGQHSIRDFIYGNRLDGSEKITTTRYNLLAEMFGFGEVERLKARLTLVLSQIKRGKVNEADEGVEAVRKQLRGLQQKYGPKCRADLELKGYQIGIEPAIARYRQGVGRLEEALGAEIVKQALNVAPPMENYLRTCENLQGLLDEQLRHVERQAISLKKIGRLVARLGTIVPDIAIADASSAGAAIKAVRAKVELAVRATEARRGELMVLEPRITERQAIRTGLQTFLQRHADYLELVGAERAARFTVENLQQRRAEGLQRQGALLERLRASIISDETNAKEIRVADQRLQRCREVIAAQPGAREAESALRQQDTRLQEIILALAEGQRRLEQLAEKTPERESAQQAASASLDWDSLGATDRFTCPCCGTGFAGRAEIEREVKAQLESEHGQELRAFLASLARRNATATRAHVMESMRANRREREALEAGQRAHGKTLASFQALTRELGETDLAESNLRGLASSLETALNDLRTQRGRSATAGIREEIVRVEAEVGALDGAAHQAHLQQIREEIARLVRPVATLVGADSLGDRNFLESKARELTTELEGLIVQRDQCRRDLDQGPAPERVREIDECLQELEGLLLTVDRRPGNLLAEAGTNAETNLERQKIYHERAVELEDLTKLFGLLSAQERSESMRDESSRHEAERQRWLECYRAIEEINTRLSKLSYSGLEQSLAEYGPLINQVYQKFIRHDVFSTLILKPTASEKARRRDLYLRLQSYAGKSAYTPASYLSEAQLNILALSIFLTRVMYQNISDLDTVFIDDPIQQMDDMNAAAFVDVILGLSQIGKQIVITTCNHDFYRLVAYKLQSVAAAGKISFKTIDLDARVESAA